MKKNQWEDPSTVDTSFLIRSVFNELDGEDKIESEREREGARGSERERGRERESEGERGREREGETGEIGRERVC